MLFSCASEPEINNKSDGEENEEKENSLENVGGGVIEVTDGW